jgi:hypothetical protein
MRRPLRSFCRKRLLRAPFQACASPLEREARKDEVGHISRGWGQSLRLKGKFHINYTSARVKRSNIPLIERQPNFVILLNVSTRLPNVYRRRMRRPIVGTGGGLTPHLASNTVVAHEQRYGVLGRACGHCPQARCRCGPAGLWRVRCGDAERGRSSTPRRRRQVSRDPPAVSIMAASAVSTRTRPTPTRQDRTSALGAGPSATGMAP